MLLIDRPVMWSRYAVIAVAPWTSFMTFVMLEVRILSSRTGPVRSYPAPAVYAPKFSAAGHFNGQSNIDHLPLVVRPKLAVC